jgi:hypothetical protein
MPSRWYKRAAQCLSHAGKAIAAMKICVVTPYFETDISWLIQGHESVKAQTIPAQHILVCDGSAAARIPEFQGTHVLLQRHYQDHGNTPRLIGCYNAITQDADAIAFLDAENWYYPDHLRSLSEIGSGAKLGAVASARMLHRLDGAPMMKCPTVDGRNFIDTSCLVVFRPAFRHLIAWTLQNEDTEGAAAQFLWRMMRDAGVPMAFVDRPTVAYRTRHQVHYDQVQTEAAKR